MAECKACRSWLIFYGAVLGTLIGSFVGTVIVNVIWRLLTAA